MTYSDAELEDARHEMWIESGQRDRDQEKHKRMARRSLGSELKTAGWRVLEYQMVNTSGSDLRIMEAVVRRGEEVKLLHWKPFNKGWMEKTPSGAWVIFQP